MHGVIRENRIYYFGLVVFTEGPVESYQRFNKWYLIYACLKLSMIRYLSRVKLSNPKKGVALSPTPPCRSY